MIDQIERFNRWNNKCPKCGFEIHFTLRSGRLGATSAARCGRHIASSRIFDRTELIERTVKFCDWEGQVVRMWDGSVRFREKNGRYLFEA